ALRHLTKCAGYSLSRCSRRGSTTRPRKRARRLRSASVAALLRSRSSAQAPVALRPRARREGVETSGAPRPSVVQGAGSTFTSNQEDAHGIEGNDQQDGGEDAKRDELGAPGRLA